MKKPKHQPPIRFWGDALPKRPNQKTDKFTDTGGLATALDSVKVDIRTTVTGSTYTGNNLAGVEFQRMRRYGLVLAKWSHPDTQKHATRWSMTKGSVEAANRVVANRAFKNLFDDDPTQDTINLKPYIGGFESGHVSDELWAATCSLIGTQAMSQLLVAIEKKNPEAFEHLSEAQVQTLEFMDNYKDYADALHQDGRRAKRNAEYFYQNLAYAIHRSKRKYDSDMKSKRGKSEARKGGKSGAPVDPPTSAPVTSTQRDRVVRKLNEYVDDDWFTPYIAKYPLELPHTGKAGRRLIPANEGKSPRAFYRMVTDPYRRIFQRKTRSLGGVVVFDCSGSMGLSEDDIRAVMRSSSGCSIVCYSASHDEERDAEYGNIHLVAKNGRQVRQLPDFAGGNGVDLPALKWAYNNLRLNSKSPVVWVSDGQVTGATDSFSSTLRDATQRYIKQKNIIWVDDVDSAIQTLKRLQAGRKP